MHRGPLAVVALLLVLVLSTTTFAVLVARPRQDTATLALDTMSLHTTAIPTLQP